MIKPEIRKAALSQISQEHWVHFNLMSRREKRVPLVISSIQVDEGEEDLGAIFARRLELDNGLVVLYEELEPIFAAASKDPHRAVIIYSKKIQERIGQSVYIAPKMGVGLRVHRVEITPYEAAIYHVLRQNKGKRMSAQDVAEEVHGRVDVKSVATIRSQIRDLKSKPAHRKTFQIDTRGRSSNKGYVYESLV